MSCSRIEECEKDEDCWSCEDYDEDLEEEYFEQDMKERRRPRKMRWKE